MAQFYLLTAYFSLASQPPIGYNAVVCPNQRGMGSEAPRVGHCETPSEAVSQIRAGHLRPAGTGMEDMAEGSLRPFPNFQLWNGAISCATSMVPQFMERRNYP